MLAYSDTQLREAQKFLEHRLKAELSMHDRLSEAMVWAAGQIVDIAVRYRIRPSHFRFSANSSLKKEVDRVLAELRERIYSEVESLSVAGDEENEKTVIAFINTETHGKTLAERINIYVNRYRFELEAAIAAGLLASLSADGIKKNIRSFMTAPYNNPYIKRAKGKASATRVQTQGVSYGAGRSNSAFNALDTLTRHTVGSAWMDGYGRKAVREGAVGFYSLRGSTYPCSTCAAYAGLFQPISQFIGAYHLNCKCIFIFVYV